MRLNITLAQSDADIAACYAVMVQLRPHLSAADFVARIRRQAKEGYQLACGQAGQSMVAVAGFRVHENLFAGKQLYVDDLVSDSSERSKGYGKQLMDWLIAYARRLNCDALHLDSGVQRFDAHRFYLAQRMRISSHHFALDLRQERNE